MDCLLEKRPRCGSGLAILIFADSLDPTCTATQTSTNTVRLLGMTCDALVIKIRGPDLLTHGFGFTVRLSRRHIYSSYDGIEDLGVGGDGQS